MREKILWLAVMVLLAGGIALGYSLYQQNTQLSKLIDLLNSQKSTSQSEQTPTVNTQPQPVSSTSSQALNANQIKFPVVVYSRAGLLNNTPEGKAEKKKLEEKFVSPYTDYNNENGINLVALHITVPQNIGEEYSVVGIFGSESQYGTEEFGFGKREQEYGFWEPSCMGPCDFSDAFKKKYPQIVNSVNSN